MKITNSNLNPISTPNADAAGRAEKSGQSGETAPAEKRDRAELSEQARLLLKARSRLEQLTAEENERLEALRQSIESGNYQVPVEKLAEVLSSRLKNI